MKTISILIIMALFIQLKAADSKIKEVVVYRNGAKITSEATFSVSAGKQDIVISNLTSTIDANSLQVKIFGNAILLSALVRTNYLGYQTLPERTRQIKDSLQLINDKIEWINNIQSVNQSEEKLLMENQQIVNEKTVVTATDIGQLADMYKKRLLNIRKERYDNQIKIRELAIFKVRLEKQLKEMQHQQGKRMGEVVLTMQSKQAGKVRAELSYLSRNAGWNPMYDLRCEGVDEDIDLVYKANVFQTTGYDWNDVSLKVSTGNPTVNNNQPVLHPWFIDFQTAYPAYGAKQKSARAMPSMTGTYLSEKTEFEADDEVQAPVPYQVMETTNQMATEYSIEVAQTVPSDGMEHVVPIQQYQLPASYRYHAVPKLDLHAFLLAKASGYNNYGLLPGQANIFFEGMYVGQTYLNPEVVSDSLVVSMGRDDRISLERNLLKDYTATKTVGTNQKVTKGYEFVIKNNKPVAVDIEVLDQVPLSKNKEIEVDIEEISGAEYTTGKGKLQWVIKLAPGETKKIRLVYTVKYPKDKSISGL